uniref:Putative ovule protein n=1 Tax=Solanum chacoense TaxID=4108 RepID=A0A0V0GTZ6_SOLCH
MFGHYLEMGVWEDNQGKNYSIYTMYNMCLVFNYHLFIIPETDKFLYNFYNALVHLFLIRR